MHSVPLVEVTRGPIVESCHHGFVAVCDGSGKVIASAGDPHTVTYMRSAAKPIQGLNILLSGAAKKFNFTDRELAIMCSSHYGEEMHKEVIYRLLDKMGLAPSALLCGNPLSISADYMKRQLTEHMVIDEANSDCSGKHCGFLSVCLTKGYPIENYNSPDHPMQQEIAKIMAHICGVEEASIHIGVDGCGVPVHSMPLSAMARAYARISTPAQLEEPYRSGCGRIFRAMNAAPEMLAGTNGFCTEFLAHTNGRFCSKLGAEAVYCIGVKDRDLGIAVKIGDGNYRALYPAVMSVLAQLDLLSPEETAALQSFASPDIINDLGRPVGKIRPCFQLTFH